MSATGGGRPLKLVRLRPYDAGFGPSTPKAPSLPQPPRRHKSRVTEPGYHKGRQPPNKGVKLETETLSVAEFRKLIDSFGQTPSGVRNRALVWLIYSADLRVGELCSLTAANYRPESAELTIPRTGRQPERKISLSSQTIALIDAWMAKRKELGIPRYAPLFCTFQKGESGRPLHGPIIGDMLRRRARSLGIDKRVHAESIRATGQSHRSRPSIEQEVIGYLDESAFQGRYPGAYGTWRVAQDLTTVDARRHASRIGHECRDAIRLFSQELAAAHGVQVKRDQGTVDVLRRVIAEANVSSTSVQQFLNALVPYWGAVSDLAQRQEHGASKEGEQLTAEDGRRLLFHSLMVMTEVDRSLPPPDQHNK